ncbi:MAG: ADP-ribosylglycohydrolase family protein [Cyanobium sp. LacPavin_0920_WC12_MAG_62_9]|nr:ADP-ribosylglycohydrolase family protein [Cyanobium sp. LacPavin_0920_WC12_MAG_62_9]
MIHHISRPIEPVDRFRGCLLGLAVGDAVGTTAEFKPRGSFPEITDLCGGGPFSLSPGEWTDDTSMALCLAQSLIHCAGFDASDQMQRYCAWQERGYMSSNGRCFDIGITVRGALDRFRRSGDPYSGSTDLRSAGNGSIMRLAPIPMAFHRQKDQLDQACIDSSRTTHGTSECLEACVLLGRMIQRALAGQSKEEILSGANDCRGLQEPRILDLARGGYRDRPATAIRGSGYVVHCLEAALWCFWSSDSLEGGILMAANLGEDADTTAAVCGQLAGAHYGASGIPDQWIKLLAQRDEIGGMADRLMELSAHPSLIRVAANDI